jgi:hypothetical protein
MNNQYAQGRVVIDVKTAWSIKWVRDNKLEGRSVHFASSLFSTRREARKYNNERFGYIRTRPDLKAEPHGWLMPVVVKVKVTIEEIGNG